MRILWIVTKPPWPMSDGGRVLVARTLEGLAAAGHRPLLVAPFDPAREDGACLAGALRRFCEPHLVAASPRSLPRALARSRWRRVPLSIDRHSLAAVARAVDRLLDAATVDVVHAEQVHAVPQCE